MYDNFVGNEMPDSVPSQLRQFHEAILRANLTTKLSASLVLDWGRQNRSVQGHDEWRGYALLARYIVSPRLRVGARAERYSDPEQVIVKTGQPYGLRVSGASLNVDTQLGARTTWRSEARVLKAMQPVFPTADGPLSRSNVLLVTSLSMTF